MRFLRPAVVILIVLLFDQVLKFWIKLQFTYNESRQIFNWFYLYFIENEGMAFGMTLGGDSGKLILTLFRLVAVLAIGYYLVKLVKEKAHSGFIISMSLIFAGAVGNILDSVFYGVLFDKGIDPAHGVFHYDGLARLTFTGYSSLFHGAVVDMFYFPIYEGYLPEWVPLWGGDYFIFFRPIFNVADSAITCGVILILLFQKKFFGNQKKEGILVKESPPSVPDVSAEEKSEELK